MVGTHAQTKRSEKERHVKSRETGEKTPGPDEPQAARKAPSATTSRPSPNNVLMLVFNGKYSSAVEPILKEKWEELGKPGGRPYTLKDRKQWHALQSATVNERSIHAWLKSVNDDSSKDDKRVIARLAATIGLGEDDDDAADEKAKDE